MTNSATLLASGSAGTLTKGNACDGITSAGAPLRIGSVALTVRDLDRVSRFYRDVIGLSTIETSADRHSLGVGTKVLLDLIQEPEVRLAHRSEAGLFHIAFLLPKRADLAGWLRHAARTGVRLHGASDHAVSEAIYLTDPEGNGIEIYCDRQSREWFWQGGMVHMGTRRLDLQALAATAADSEWTGLPQGCVVGHVHLQVGEIGPAEHFYAQLLGLDITSRVPGASFYSSGGYHHHVATNSWNSAGAGPRTPGTTGLRSFEIVPANAGIAAALADRARGLEVAGWDGGLEITDPWGTRVRLRTH